MELYMPLDVAEIIAELLGERTADELELVRHDEVDAIGELELSRHDEDEDVDDRTANELKLSWPDEVVIPELELVKDGTLEDESRQLEEVLRTGLDIMVGPEVATEEDHAAEDVAAIELMELRDESELLRLTDVDALEEKTLESEAESELRCDPRAS
jgi:hypothetical protein